MLNYMFTNAAAEFFEMDKIQEFLKINQQFDLVIVEEFITYALMGFCHHYNATCVTFSASGLSWLTSNQVGNPNHPAYIQNTFLPYASNLNFLQRFLNSLLYVFSELVTHLYTLPRHNKILQEHFPDAPHITELYYNVSLTLINYHVGTHPSVPLLPNMIDVGGFHIKPPKVLPKDIQEYLNSAKEGVIFFSMGSNLRSVDMPLTKREMLLKTFEKLKQKVLWKWEDENLPGKPSNVKIAKWLPQTDVLVHPNVKLFITHGGLLGTTEAVYHGVPIVVLPLYGGQHLNLANAKSSGIGCGVPFHQLTEEILAHLVHKVLTDRKYAENAKRRSSIMPMTALERGVFWVEYILRHKGAPHLRTAALNLAWYQYLLLDVTTFVLVMSAVIYWVARYFVRTFICSKRNISKPSTKKKRN